MTGREGELNQGSLCSPNYSVPVSETQRHITKLTSSAYLSHKGIQLLSSLGLAPPWTQFQCIFYLGLLGIAACHSPRMSFS